MSVHLSGWKITYMFNLLNYLVFFFSFFVVVGEKEVLNDTANVRTRDNKVHGEHSIVQIIERFKDLDRNKVPDAEEKF